MRGPLQDVAEGRAVDDVLLDGQDAPGGGTRRQIVEPLARERALSQSLDSHRLGLHPRLQGGA
jgi:hypothetical protein